MRHLVIASSLGLISAEIKHRFVPLFVCLESFLDNYDFIMRLLWVIIGYYYGVIIGYSGLSCVTLFDTDICQK